MPSRRRAHRHSAMRSQTRPSAFWHGYTRSSSSGQTTIHGLMTKVHDGCHCPAHQRAQLTNSSFPVLTWVSLYWFSRAGPAATLRIYFEFANGGDTSLVLDVPNALMGVSYFPREISIPPRRYVLRYRSVSHLVSELLTLFVALAAGCVRRVPVLCSRRRTNAAAILQLTRYQKYWWMTCGVCLGRRARHTRS